jgi:hypothetical protein
MQVASGGLRRVTHLFDRALSLSDPREREAFLAAHPDETAAVAEVRALPAGTRG